MIQALPMVRRLAALAALLAPALALGDDKPKETPKRDGKVTWVVDESKSMSSDAKLAALEATLQALLKEIQALRSAPTTAKTPTPHTVVRTRPADPAGKDDHAVIQLWLETKDGKTIIAGEEKKADPKPKSGKDIVIIEGATGERKVIGIEELQNLKDVKARIARDVKPTEVDEAKKKANEFRVKDLVGSLQNQLLEAKPAKTPVTVQARSIVHDVAKARPPADGETIALSRTTYALPANKAAALANFLKEVAQVKVLETMAEGDKLTVTTTPDVQSTIGQIVGLMTAKPVTATIRMQFDNLPVLEKPVKP